MKIHEHQGKELFRKYNIPVPNGAVAFDPKQALAVAPDVSSDKWVVKAQIHAGGRGKGGGVKLAKNKDQLREYIESIYGMTLVTPQTGPEGKVVKRLLIEAPANIQSEFYLAVTLDRAASKLVLIASPAGGMDIEEVAEHCPEKIFKVAIDPLLGLRSFQVRRLSKALKFTGKTEKQFASILSNILKLYSAEDCSLVEINPLVLTDEADLVAIDAKLTFDDNALYRHPTLQEMADPNEEDPKETQAKKFDLNYISLDGNIGCMVNGAGLAMSTMDIIKLEGGSPANFLDVGGGASEEKVMEAFKIILRDPNVKGVLVNIFGGIMKCDVIASGIVSAAKQLNIHVPVVVRLEGTNVDLGKQILEQAGIAILSASSMKEAAQKIVKATSEARS